MERETFYGGFTAPYSSNESSRKYLRIGLQTTYRHVDECILHEIKRLKRCKSSPDIDMVGGGAGGVGEGWTGREWFSSKIHETQNSL